MSNPALAGVAATRDTIIVADRDPADRVDIFRCFNADGSERWTIRYPAPGNLDYGNSSRATPLVHGDLVYLSGAQGHFHAVELATGKIRWKKHFQRDFGGPEKLSWGFCSSPLIADDRLVIHPGGPQAAIVALAPGTGETLWKSPGRPPGHSSLLLATFGGQKQIVGYDVESLGGWDLATGKRLWTLKPDRPGDFNVPTPIIGDENLIVATENNGARIYGFDAQGLINPKPLGRHDDLRPDCPSPVLANQRLFGVSGGLFCLDAPQHLTEIWHSDAEEFQEYASVIASPHYVLVTTLKGRLILVNARSDKFEKVSELQLFEDEAGLYAHPALVGRRLYVRGSKSLVCLDLDDSKSH
ncbi:MAG: outer rane biosis protein BamB [Planctomycetaceae bacterium]|nr:outer rane biosis protein BamB [Planctomycetaceae bacterium]